MKKIFSLGNLYVSDFVKEQNPNRKKYELDICLDENGTAKMTSQPPSGDMWGKYWYRSGTNQTMTRELKEVIDSCLEIYKPNDRNVWLDIACNDGTLLRQVPESFEKFGVDPADNSFYEESTKYATVFQDYFSKEVLPQNFKANIITTIAMFYDLPNPQKFIRDAYECLEDNGLWCIQMSYTPLMVEQMAFDNMCFKEDAFVSGINKKISDIMIGDKVLGYDGEYTKVLNTFKNKYNGKFHKIKAKYLEKIECTEEHPFLIVKKGNITTHKKEWVEAKNLQVDDFLLVPKIKTKEIDRNIDLSQYNNTESPYYRKGLKSLYLSDDFLWMLGLYLAEGHIAGKKNNLQIHFTLHQKETHYSDRLVEIFKNIGYKTKIRKSKVNNSMDVSVSCTALARILEVWFGKYAKNKKIPDFLFRAPKEVVIPFLNGLIDGDGSENNSGQIGLHSSSKTLIYQVQLMLANLDAMLGISHVKSYPREIRGKPFTSGDSWQTRGTNSALDDIFSTKQRKDRKRQFESDEEYIYVPISSIEVENYEGDVYNFETENHTYVVSNAVVHNCHEHSCYYSLTDFKKLMEQNGFIILDCTLNDANGGSFRVFMRKDISNEKMFGTQQKRDIYKFNVESLLEYERKLGVSTEKYWKKFFKGIKKLKKQTILFLKECKKNKKIVYGYGASTKGNTLLQYFGIDKSLMPYIVERSSYKFGLKTVGTDIPIISEEEMRQKMPDYLFVLPWHFIDEFVQREKQFLENGGKFVVPCPKFEIIGKSENK